MVSFEILLKAMPPSLSELKVLPSFCFAFKIPDDRTVTSNHIEMLSSSERFSNDWEHGKLRTLLSTKAKQFLTTGLTTAL